jgi:hypothetical protein
MRVLRAYAIALSILASGCGDRGAVTFSLKVPANPLFNPVAEPVAVSEYDLRTSSGQVIGIAGAVQGSAESDNGLLPLGALTAMDGPEDVFVTALSGTNLVGEARIRDVTIKPGKRQTYEAQLRKPLVFVGSALPPESGLGNRTSPVQIFDPTASADLAKSGGNNAPVVTPGMTAGAVSWDGRFLFAVAGGQLGVFDTGLGMNVGSTLSLPFAPTRVAVAPRDRVLVALAAANGSDGAIGLIGDVAGLAANPAAGQLQTVPLPGQVARAVAFSNDGNTMYVLTGGTLVDPCSPGGPPPSNAIIVVSATGQVGATYNLPGFVSDIAIDRATGVLVLAEAVRGQISTLDPAQLSGGNAAPTQVLGNLTCPSAVRVANGVAFVVTSDRDDRQTNAFMLQRLTLNNGQSTPLSFGGPSYAIPLQSTASANGNVQKINIFVRPGSLEAYELTITPDGNLATFATRARYKELGTKFGLGPGQDCTANFDVIEYGLYTVDIRTGNASYKTRSQVVVTGLQVCLTCTLPGFPGEQNIGSCPAQPGDRPAGLTAAFGQ